MENQIKKSVKVLTRIKDYFLEAVEKFSKTIGDASKTLMTSLKRIEKDLQSIEMGELPASEKATSTAVITTVLSKRGEIMSTQDLWAALTGKLPIPEPEKAKAETATSAFTSEVPTQDEKVETPSVPSATETIETQPLPEIPQQPPTAPLEAKTPEAPVVPAAETTQAPTTTAPFSAPSKTEEKPTVGSLKSEMLKELKRLKKLMTGMT
ncbi:MAG: hypothetical protein ACTSYR_03500 [Candidatus Odinarchaeia archaeon]